MTAVTVIHLLNQAQVLVNKRVAPGAAYWSMGAELDRELIAKAGALNLTGI